MAVWAKAKGLLDPKKLTQLVKRAVELDKPRQKFRELVEQMRAYPDEPMQENMRPTSRTAATTVQCRP